MKLLRFERLSVRTKLFLAIFAPSLVVLLTAITGMLAYDVYELKQALLDQAKIDARLMAGAVNGPLSISESALATEFLSNLKADPNVLAAAVYDRNDAIFARYPARGDFPYPRIPIAVQTEDRVSVIERVHMGEIELGTIWLQISLREYYTRFYYSVGGAVVGLGLLLAVAGWMAGNFQRQFSQPLQSLIETAKDISIKNDYAVRAPAQAAPEFNVVTTAFNHMLDEMEKRNRALVQRGVELENANRELEAFSYSVAHDLRTPLRAIASFSQILRESLGATLPPEDRSLVDRIENNAARMAALIDDLLAFSRVDAEPLVRRMVEPAKIVQEVWAELADQRAGREVDFQLDSLPEANADEALLQQVYQNLLSNALKYSRTKTVANIHVGAERTDGKTTYFVKDNGVGFNMAYYEKLFGVFQRLHSGKEFEGTGVGLALVQRIISRHGGTVWAESAVNQGAQFYFTLS